MIYDELTECELIIMKCIWDADEAVTCKQIMATLQNQYKLNYKDTTVYTFIKNLKEKGYVESYKESVTYYKPKYTKEYYCEKQMRSMKDFWFAGSAFDMLDNFIKNNVLSKDEKDKLVKILNNN